MVGCLRVNPFNQRELVGLGRLPTKVTVSRTENGSGNEFNISAADSCTLIVAPVKQTEHFQRLRVYLDDLQVIVSHLLPFFLKM